MEKRIVLVLLLLSSVFVALALKFPVILESSVILSPIGEIKLKTSLPRSPAEVPIYRVVGDESH